MLPHDEELGNELLRGVRVHNFIPKGSAEAYVSVLKPEYLRYYHQRISGEPLIPVDYGQWEGYAREQIPWFPTVSTELCNGCIACIEVCPKGVFKSDGAGKVFVVDPFLCIVGCCFCKGACQPKAILMPKSDMLNSYRHARK